MVCSSWIVADEGRGGARYIGVCSSTTPDSRVPPRYRNQFLDGQSVLGKRQADGDWFAQALPTARFLASARER